MSAPFPNQNFLEGNWQSLNDLARKTGEAFPVVLPGLSALDFDKIKDSVCAYRGWGLCSVDAVTIAADGRIFLIEFKDTQRDPISWLRKKGFDSLVLFWLAIGCALTMEEIRDRAVFCYVSTREERYDDVIAMGLKKFAGETAIASRPDQLDELHNSGLYGEVCHLDPNEFCTMIRNVGIAHSLEELRERLSLRYRPSQARPLVPRPKGVSTDFKMEVSCIAELRMPCPFDRVVHGKHPDRLLHAAETYDSSVNTIAWTHNWDCDFPIMSLMACSFDSFVLWSLACHSDVRLSEKGSELCEKVEFAGNAPKTVPEPEDVPKNAYRRRFWKVFAPYFGQKYGLTVHERECLCRQINIESWVPWSPPPKWQPDDGS